MSEANNKTKIKVIYNICHGGFGFSRKATEMAASRGHKRAAEFLKCLNEDYDPAHERFFSWNYCIGRHDPLLVSIVEELGTKEASADLAELAIYEIEGTKYNIDDYDGWENVQTPENMEWIDTDKGVNNEENCCDEQQSKLRREAEESGATRRGCLHQGAPAGLSAAH